MEDIKQAVGVVKNERLQVIIRQAVVDSSKPDSQNNFLWIIDRAGNQYGLAYMDLVTRVTFVTGLLDFTREFVRKSVLSRHEVVLGVITCQEEKQIFKTAR